MKWLAVFALAVVVFASGCTVPSNTPPNSSGNSTQPEINYSNVVYGTVPENFTWENYTDSEKGFSLEYPSYMDVINNTPEASVFFLAPRENELDYRENVNIRITSFAVNVKLNLDTYGAAVEKALNNEYYQLKVEQSFNTNLDNQTVRQMVFSGTSKVNLLRMKFMETIWVENRSAYEMTYSAAEEEYGRFEGVAEKMAGSFRLA